MAKVIKEIIIMLLVCLVGLLLFAVIFYEYIPSRKVVAEVTTYEASSEVEDLLADDFGSNDNVLATYTDTQKVTSSDLSNYEATDDYVPGKSNPFAVISTGEDEEDTEGTTDTNTNTSTSSNNSTNTTNSTSENTSTNTSTSNYTKDTGTK